MSRSPRSPRRLLAGAVAAGVALLGALLVAAGLLRATVLSPESGVEASLQVAGAGPATGSAARPPVVTTPVGLLELDGPGVAVRAEADGPVFLGIGRAADVEAYLRDVARLEVTGHDGEGNLRVARAGSEKTVSDPADADIWVVSAQGEDGARLDWAAAPGQWRLVAATDGESPAPHLLTVRWTGRELRSDSPALIAAGVVALVIGGAGLVLAGSASLPAALRPAPAPRGRDASATSGAPPEAAPEAAPGTRPVPASDAPPVPVPPGSRHAAAPGELAPPARPRDRSDGPRRRAMGRR